MAPAVVKEEVGTVYLFATKTCPNCKIAAKMLDAKGISYEKVYAEDNPTLAGKYGIKQAPSIVELTEEGVTVYAGAGNVRKFIDANGK